MDPVTDLPPAARSQQDHLQMIAATLTALAATMDRVAYRRDLAAGSAQKDLGTARRELRDALHAAAPASGAPRRAAAGGSSRLSTDPAGRPPTVGPDQEEALVLAGYYSRRAERLAQRGVLAGGAAEPAEPAGQRVADRWAAYAGTLAESDRRGRRWAEPAAGQPPQWAEPRWARDRAERAAQRAAGWHAQADLLDTDPDTGRAAAVSRRRAEEADILAGYWQQRADRLETGGSAYDAAGPQEDSDLGRGLAALARVTADEGRAADATNGARAESAAAATEAATADVLATQADEYGEGLDRAAAYLGRAPSATAAATRAGADATAELAATAKFIAETPTSHARPVMGAGSQLRAANLLHRTGRGRAAP